MRQARRLNPGAHPWALGGLPLQRQKVRQRSSSDAELRSPRTHTNGLKQRCRLGLPLAKPVHSRRNFLVFRMLVLSKSGGTSGQFGA